jgi:hypothetical protein
MYRRAGIGQVRSYVLYFVNVRRVGGIDVKVVWTMRVAEESWGQEVCAQRSRWKERNNRRCQGKTRLDQLSDLARVRGTDILS